MSVSERLLIARLRDRDEEAFNEIVRLHGDRVYNLVARMIGNRAEAEDIAQEVFVTVFKTIDTFREECQFSTWLLRIASNHCKNRLKLLSRTRTDGKEMDHDRDQHLSDDGRAPAHHIHPPDKILEAAQLDRWMQQAIDLLDEEQRLILILRDVEELSYEELMEVTGLTEGTIKSRLHRARMVIKEFLENNMR